MINVGNEKAYKTCQEPALEKRIASEELYSAQTISDMQMDWGLWGPVGL